MKSLKCIASFTALAFVLSGAAFAKDKVKDSGSFDLSEPAHVGSTLLQPGHYKAEWTGPENALKVSILDHGKTVATTDGTMKQLPSKARQSSVILKDEQGNSKQVEEIDFTNHTGALVFSGM